jgi:ATP-grasp domain, R2K clade family 3
MSITDVDNLDIFLLENTVWIASSMIDVPRYDFSFDMFFSCRRPYQRPEHITAIGRFGAIENYGDVYKTLENEGISLIHTPEQHRLASELTAWYPLIQDITPRSLCFDLPPEASVIEQHFSYPVFIKGSRQTSRHKADLSIVHSHVEYEFAVEQYRKNAILHWQSFVCREYVALRSVSIKQSSDKIPPSFEFRTFWWHGACVGSGAYWADFASYTWTEAEKFAALQVARKAAERLEVPFLVIDVAQTAKGDWIAIECNDAQESGYAAIAPISLWQNIVDSERTI